MFYSCTQPTTYSNQGFKYAAGQKHNCLAHSKNTCWHVAKTNVENQQQCFLTFFCVVLEPVAHPDLLKGDWHWRVATVSDGGFAPQTPSPFMPFQFPFLVGLSWQSTCPDNQRATLKCSRCLMRYVIASVYYTVLLRHDLAEWLYRIWRVIPPQ